MLAHAGSCRVAVFYVAASQPSAAYLVEWDTWREAGVREGAGPALWGCAAAGRCGEYLLEGQQRALPCISCAPMQAHVHPLYLDEAGGGNGGGAATTESLLQRALFQEHGLSGVLGAAAPRDAAVLLSGLEGELAAHLTRELTRHGVDSERIMVCDY